MFVFTLLLHYQQAHQGGGVSKANVLHLRFTRTIPPREISVPQILFETIILYPSPATGRLFYYSCSNKTKQTSESCAHISKTLLSTMKTLAQALTTTYTAK